MLLENKTLDCARVLYKYEIANTPCNLCLCGSIPIHPAPNRLL